VPHVTSTLMTEAEMVSETLDHNSILTHTADGLRKLHWVYLLWKLKILIKFRSAVFDLEYADRQTDSHDCSYIRLIYVHRAKKAW
jgi:hypothetical protein